MRLGALVLIAWLGPAALVAQDNATQERYDAAIAWVNLLKAGDYERAAAQANAAVADKMTPDVLRDAWEKVGAQVGALHSLEPQSQTMAQGFHVVVLTGEFDNGTFDVQVAMADDGTVAGIYVRPPGT